jgi:hypothetical protein
MPIEIDPSLAKNLKNLHSAENYPKELAWRLWRAQGATKPNATPCFKIATASTALVRGQGFEAVTWYGFRSESNKRLPQFYACELPDLGGKRVDLYAIGAVGNSFDVDVLVTDLHGKLMKDVLFEARNFSGNFKPVKLHDGLYGARKARWSLKRKGAKNTMVLESAAICLLWVISYRHSKYGSRKYDPFPIPVGDKAIRQDDDGSPGDGEPGGEGGP